MKLVVALTVVVAILAAAQQGPLTSDGRPDFQGVYRYDTMTPVERPPELVNRAALTQAERDAFARRRRAKLARGPSAYDEAWLERLVRRSEREDDIAGACPSSREAGITGIHEEHSVDNGRAGAVDRSAFSGHAVDGTVLVSRVVLPDHLAITRRIGAHHPIRRG